jgi:hypothetical protein
MLTVIVPSRGRPEAALQLINTVADTRQVHDTGVVLAVDHDDPMLDLYREVAGTRPDIASVEVVRGGWMVAALNEAALRVASDPGVTAIGFLGDDHRPRTPGWDASYLSALTELGAGIVYGNDLLQYDFVPTQCAMSANIVRALGWMAHPNLRHMYVDTLWRDMGNAAGKLRYLRDVVVEHLHYINGKAVEDEHYQRVNSREVYDVDERAFRDLHATGEVLRAGRIIQNLSRMPR